MNHRAPFRLWMLWMLLAVQCLSGKAAIGDVEAVRFPVSRDALPGKAEASKGHRGSAEVWTLSNSVLEAEWRLEKDSESILRLVPGQFRNKIDGRKLVLPTDAFNIQLDGIGLLTSRSLVAESVQAVLASEDGNASRLAQRIPGVRLEVQLADPNKSIDISWWAELRDGAGYLRTGVACSAATGNREQELRVSKVVLFDGRHSLGARTVGSGQGAVVTLGDSMFVGLEHPQADNGHGEVGLDSGEVLRRWVPGEVVGETYVEADITSHYMPGHALTLYLDNHHSDLPVEILAVAVVVQDAANSEHELHFDDHRSQPGFSSRQDSKGNIYHINLPGRALTSKQRAVARFHVRGKGTYEGEWLIGLQRSGRPDRLVCALRCDRRLQTKDEHEVFAASLVIGVTPVGQLRRSFLHYIERERAHPARPVLHYNSWYDIGTGLPFGAEDARDRLRKVADELARRGVKLDAVLFDDGWDDPDKGPWSRNAGFEGQAFQRLRSEAAFRDVGLGWWFSPFGGYHEPRQRRVAAARRAGLEVREEVTTMVTAVNRGAGACNAESPCRVGEGDCDTDQGCLGNLYCFQRESDVNPPGVNASLIKDRSIDFCVDPSRPTAFLGLGVPEYFQHMRSAVSRWLQEGAIMFKVDGIGNPNGGKWRAWEDFEAATRLIAELRRIRESIFINLSTGTWPSPFWLLHSDTVWRGGHDHFFHGEGPERERWITYRDTTTFTNVVQRWPLFPLSSLMTHGVIFAKDAWNLTSEDGHGRPGERATSSLPFRHEVRTGFGAGTMLQELYVTPDLLSSENWDDVASAARWARSAAEVMADVHWIGDPSRNEVYGWAAWRDVPLDGEGRGEERAILTLRNPSRTARAIAIDPTVVFELPQHARGWALELRTPFLDQGQKLLTLTPGAKTVVQLAPFEVLVFDTAAPAISLWQLWLERLKQAQPQIKLSLVVGGILFVIFRLSHPSGSGGSSQSRVPNAEELRRRRLVALSQGKFSQGEQQ